MSTIKLNTDRISTLATTLRSFEQRLDAIGRNLDAALRPARRSDVPELGQIDGTYGPLRGRISQGTISLGHGASDLRRYVQRVHQVEAMLAVAKFELSIGRFGADDPVVLPPGMTVEEAANLGLLGWGAATVHSNGVAHYVVNGTDGLTYLGAKQLAVGMALTPLGLVLDGKTVLDSNAVVTDRAYSAVSFTVTTAGVAGTGLTMVGATGVGGALTAASGAAAPFILATGTGLYIGNTMREGYERDAAEGRSSLGRIWTGRYTPTQQVTAAAETAGYGVYKGAEWAGQRYYGAKEYVPDDLVGNDAAKIIMATVRAEHPDASMAQLDGRFRITIPGPNGVATKIEFDNVTWKAIG